MQALHDLRCRRPPLRLALLADPRRVIVKRSAVNLPPLPQSIARPQRPAPLLPIHQTTSKKFLRVKSPESLTQQKHFDKP